MAEKFGVSKSTVHRCLGRFCYAMTKFHSQFISFPSSEEAAEIADRIQRRHGYPQAFGAIDGSHIAINPSSVGLADYINRKMFPSIVLQGLVDDNYLFRDVSCKCPGSMHDSNVLSNSSLYQILNDNGQMPARDKIFNGVSVPLHILGDPAYSLTRTILKGYPGRNLSAEQESFNAYHSGARMMVENAFGRLKSRWRMLSKRMDCHVSLSPYVIMTCCCLHNMCEKLKLQVNPLCKYEPSVPSDQPIQEPDQCMEAGASEIRNAICRYMAANLPLRQSSYQH